MDSSFSLKDEIWFLGVCHHISNVVYIILLFYVTAFQHYLTSIAGHSVVATLPRNYIFLIIQQTVSWNVEF